MGSRQSTQAKISQTSRTSGGRGGGGEARAGRRTPLWPLLAALVLLAAVLPHLPSLQYGFVWDDKFMIGPQIDLTGPAASRERGLHRRADRPPLRRFSLRDALGRGAVGPTNPERVA